MSEGNPEFWYCGDCGYTNMGSICTHCGWVRPVENKTVTKWADPAMFTAEPIDVAEGPRVYLLSMTPDPLGSIAAACKMYKGEVVRSLSDVTDEERLEYFEQVQKTKLQAPFEFVKFHFMIEGVTRAFTHQMVRQRTAVFAQESLRFAVKEDMPVGLPPSLVGTGKPRTLDDRAEAARAKGGMGSPEYQRLMWGDAISEVQEAYQNLIDSGMPAEDARGLLPHNVLTRLHYSTDLRALLDHAGNRLCTQAQFEWRLVFSKIVEAIRGKTILDIGAPDAIPGELWAKATPEMANGSSHVYMADKLAEMFRPVCYQTGKCEFKANFDRACSIRSRVDANADLGRPPSEWGEELNQVQGDEIVSGINPDLRTARDAGNRPVFIGAIRPVEWLANPGAAR